MPVVDRAEATTTVITCVALPVDSANGNPRPTMGAGGVGWVATVDVLGAATAWLLVEADGAAGLGAAELEVELATSEFEPEAAGTDADGDARADDGPPESRSRGAEA